MPTREKLTRFLAATCGTVFLLGERIAPPSLFGHNLGIRRITELPLDPDTIPQVDVVLLSHAHHDLWDTASLRMLERHGATAVIPRGDEDLVPSGCFERVVELDWNGWTAEAEIGDRRVRAVEVEHAGWRWGADERYRVYNGYVLEKDGVRILFIGDTASGWWRKRYRPGLSRRADRSQRGSRLVRPTRWSSTGPTPTTVRLRCRTMFCSAASPMAAPRRRRSSAGP